MPDYNKHNLIQWCDDCGQGWIYAVKNKLDGRLYCICSETKTVWETPADIRKRRCVCDVSPAQAQLLPNLKNALPVEFVPADPSELWESELTRPHNKVCLCHVCGEKDGWIVMKKAGSDNVIYLCEYCKSIWRDIEDALKMRPADGWSTEAYQELTREEVISRGLDRYDDVLWLDDKE